MSLADNFLDFVEGKDPFVLDRVEGKHSKHIAKFKKLEFDGKPDQYEMWVVRVDSDGEEHVLHSAPITRYKTKKGAEKSAKKILDRIANR